MGIDIYVAGKTDDWERVQRIQEALVNLGHGITYDWTQIVEEVGPEAGVDGTLDERKRRECADDDMVGVRNADLIIACMSKGVCGTLIEIGMALVYDPPEGIILVGEPERDSIFFALPNIHRVEDESQIVDLLPA